MSDASVVKVVLRADGGALYFSRAPIPWDRDRFGATPEVLGEAGQWYRHVGLYAYRRSALLVLASLEPTPRERAEALEQLRALEHGIRIAVVETAHASQSVDTPDDLERARQRWLAAGSSV